VRGIFWAVFLPPALIAGVHFWKQNEPHKNNPYFTRFIVDSHIKKLAGSDPREAAQAWMDLNVLYIEHCATYLNVMKHRTDPRPIRFGVVPGEFRIEGYPPVPGFVSRPDASETMSRTVGEAVSAILYNRYAWKSDFEGNWAAWWDANRQHYELSGDKPFQRAP
jgi:hypothetical protein